MGTYGPFLQSCLSHMLRIVAATCEVIRTIVHSTTRIPESKRPTLIALSIVWVVSAVYIFGFIDRGWIPHDEGSLAQMAERVLNGELPHRDFDDIYTGGLSFFYAAVFKTLGVSLLSIRTAFYLFILALVPVLYGIAIRFAPPLIAAVVTMSAVVWSAPNYFAGMPSWFNLFFAAIGTFALIRHIETQYSRWLYMAGLCGGLSLLAKVSGIFYIAAVFLFFSYRELALSNDGASRSSPHFSSFLALKGLGYLAFLAAAAWLLRNRLGPMEVFYFLLPFACICGALLWLEWMEGQGRLRKRLRALAGLMVPFSAGIVVPIAFFMLPYILNSSLHDLYGGLIVLSQKRLQYASMAFPPLVTVINAFPYGLLLLLNVSRSRRAIVDRVFALIVALALGAIVVSASNVRVYQFAWQSARSLSVVAVLAGCSVLARSSCEYRASSRTTHQVLVLLMLVTALQGLIQFPFAAPIYYCYVAPLVALTVLAVVSLHPATPKPLHFCVLGFYFFFAVLWMNTSYLNAGLGYSYSPYRADSLLDSERAPIRVPADEGDTYSELIRVVRQHARSGYMYAAPDCPEVYFLAGLRNPTRRIFDFLSAVQEDPSTITRLLESKAIKIAVINREPAFSPTLDAGVTAVLEQRFPESTDIGKFRVRWAD